jgi:hypothetical protein
MANVHVSEDIGAPVNRVFSRFTDIEHGSEYVSGIKKVDMMTLGPLHLGSRWTETREVMGRLDDAEMEITAFEQDKAYTITHHKAGIRIDTTFTFEPISTGTRVNVEFAFNPQGLPPSLLAPLEWATAGRVRQVLSHDLADLKGVIEGAAVN